jgi:hypothetical protein
MSGEDREDLTRLRAADEEVRRRTASLLDALAGRDQTESSIELRKINQLLHQEGFDYPQGAAGVADLIQHMGAVQLHEDCLPGLLASLNELGPLPEPLRWLHEQITRALAGL